MNIAMIVPFFKTGGVETFIIRLSTYLMDKGHDVTVIATHDKGNLWDSLSAQKIDNVFFNMKGSLTPFTQLLSFVHYLKKNNFDVIMLNNDRYAQSILNLMPDRTVVIPIIHSDADWAYQTGCANAAAWNAVVGVSPKVYDMLKARITNRPIVQITYGVEMPKEDLWQNRTKFDDELRLLFVGRIEHVQKGVFLLPDVLDACLKKDLKVSLSIIGEGSDLERLKEIIENKSLTNHVSFSDFLPPDKIYDILLSHHVLLMPSFFEGLGIIALEAQACGCVPIASELEKVTDQSIQNGITGILTESGNVEEIVAGILTIYHSPEKWSSMSEKGHFRIKDMFSVESMGDAYLNLFQDALSGNYLLPYPCRKHYTIDYSLLSWKDFVPNVFRKLKWFIVN